MTDMPKIVTHLTGDVSGLAKAVAEGETLVDRYGENVEKKTRVHGERAGEAGGRGLTEKLEEELGRPTVAERPLAGIAKKVEAKFKEIGQNSGKGLAAGVEAEVKTLETKLQTLADEIMRTGNFDLMKQFKSTQGDLGILSRVKKEFEQVKAEAAKLSVDALIPGDQNGRDGGGMISGLIGKIGKIAGGITDAIVSGGQAGFDSLSELAKNHQVAAAIAAGIVLGSPMIGAAINAAVLLGIGAGGIAVGVVAAFQDPQVKGAWSSAMSGIFDEFKKASAPLVEPLIQGASKVQAAFGRAGPAIENSMKMAAPVVDHLISGIAQMIDNVGPGFAEAFAASMPIIDMLGNEMLPKMGDALGQFFRSMAAGGPGATMFFHDLIDVVSLTIVYLGGMVEWLSKVYEWGSKLGMIGTPILGWLADLLPAGDKGKQGLDKTAEGAAHASTEVDKAKKSLSDFISEAFHMQDSQLALQKGLFDIAKAFDQNGASLDISTEKGLANREAMQHQIETIARWRQEQLDAGKAPAYVNSEIDKQIALMYNDAKAHHANTAELDALVAQWRTILNLPAYKSLQTDVITNRIDRGGPAPGAGAGGGPRMQRWGGIVQHAAGGMVTRPGVYQGQGDGFTVMAERETKKEGYFPQNTAGPHAYELLSEMASWKGWSIDTGGGGRGGGYDGASAPTGGGGAGQQLTIHNVFQVDGRVLYEEVILPQQQQFINNNGSSGGR